MPHRVVPPRRRALPTPRLPRAALLLAWLGSGCRDGCPRLSPSGTLRPERRADGGFFVASSDGGGACAVPLHVDIDPATVGPSRRRVLAHWPAQTDPARSGWSDIAEGEHPVVIFTHAQVAQSCAIYDRYRRLHEDWAARGWVVLSVAAGGALCGSMDADNLEGRTELLEAGWEGLSALLRGQGELGPFLQDALDIDTVVLSGHSRGGGAALLAAGRASAAGRPPAGVLAFQPVDPAAWSVALPAIPSPALIVLAERDTDVTAAHTASLPDALAGPWATVEVPGGVHAWTMDDLPPRAEAEPGTTAGAQRALTDAVAGRFLDELDDDEAAGPLPWRWAPLVDRVSAEPVRMRWGGRADALLVDDFDDEQPDWGLHGPTSSEGLDEDHEGVPFPESTAGRHKRARWRRISGSGTLHLAAPWAGERATVELHALLDPGAELTASLGAEPVRLEVAAPGDDTLRSAERPVLLQAEVDNAGVDQLSIGITGGAWLDSIVLINPSAADADRRADR